METHCMSALIYLILSNGRAGKEWGWIWFFFKAGFSSEAGFSSDTLIDKRKAPAAPSFGSVMVGSAREALFNILNTTEPSSCLYPCLVDAFSRFACLCVFFSPPAA